METSGLDDESVVTQALSLMVNNKPLLEICPEAKTNEVQTYLNLLQRGINDKVVGSESGANGPSARRPRSSAQTTPSRFMMPTGRRMRVMG